ncbi:MAG: hypothetical protein EZS28_000396 [Streblomastix strix]|uniref:Uncharacterized protein n=1 Tax=Streblomastix strix TaxID=222440 RepID=A0A5J4XA80_9EUKA|nr:MAG: hypothetical protein EZS28_000396 [Streblomastix strix]
MTTDAGDLPMNLRYAGEESNYEKFGEEYDEDVEDQEELVSELEEPNPAQTYPQDAHKYKYNLFQSFSYCDQSGEDAEKGFVNEEVDVEEKGCNYYDGAEIDACVGVKVVDDYTFYQQISKLI